MCFLNYPDYPDYDVHPMPQGVPHLVWATPVNASELGASLEAYVETLPQATALRLCHRFRECSLSALPQEILEQIIDDVRTLARSNIQVKWDRDFLCFEGICADEDHYAVYGKHVEDLWHAIIDMSYGQLTKEYGQYTKEEKIKMVQDWLKEDPREYLSDDIWDFHLAAHDRWMQRTCLCPPKGGSEDKGFLPLNQILRSHFGLDALISHETLSKAMFEWLPITFNDEHAYSTVCYLTIAPQSVKSGPSHGKPASKDHPMFSKFGDHTAFRQMIDPSQLSISENERIRFPRALKCLNLKTAYYMSDLEPEITHPIQDQSLREICCCSKPGCGNNKTYDYTEKTNLLKTYLETKSEELSKQSWPKLMNIAASNAASPNGWR